MKKISLLLAILLFVTSVNVPMTAKGDVQEKPAETLQSIKENVTNQFENLCDANSKWEGAKIEYDKALFDLENEIRAYLFKVIKDGNEVGYLISDTNEANHIIEFGKECFIEEAMEKVEDTCEIKEENQKVYYLGALNYVIGGENQDEETVYVDVTTSDFEQLSQTDFEVNGASKKEPKDELITYPSKYESGYKSFSAYNVTKWDLKYFIMTEFSDGKVCYPTAATNLLYYWYSSRGAKYSNLKNGTWKKTYSALKEGMATIETVGTADTKVSFGLNTYLGSRGYDHIASFHANADKGKKIVSEIHNNNRPCILLLHGHKTYRDHGVLALGYQKFEYSDRDEIYIRIMDGWTNKANRFVYGNSGGTWRYVTVAL